MTTDPVFSQNRAVVIPQKWNRYAYSLDNPLRYVDPNGFDPIPATLLQFYNTVLKMDFSTVELRTGSVGRFVTGVAGAEGVTHSTNIFLSADAAAEFERRTADGIALIGHELLHVRQYQDLAGCIGLACAGPGFLKTYAVEYVGNRLRGQSRDEAYVNIAVERAAYQLQLQLLSFFQQHPDILRKLQAGQALSASDLAAVRAEFGGVQQ